MNIKEREREIRVDMIFRFRFSGDTAIFRFSYHVVSVDYAVSGISSFVSSEIWILPSWLSLFQF